MTLTQPFFSDMKLDFIKEPYTPADEIWVMPELVKEFISVFFDKMNGDQVKGFFVDLDDGTKNYFVYSLTNEKIPEIFLMHPFDLGKAIYTLNVITLDYCPTAIQEEFNGKKDDYPDTESFLGHVDYELKRVQDWIIQNGGRKIKNEIIKRFGFAEEEFQNNLV